MDSVYSFLLHFHSGWAYLVLLLSFIMLVASVYHFVTKKPLHRNIRKVFFYTVLSFHIQFLVGLIMFIYKAVNASLSFKSLEHPIMMFTAVILITIANAKLKRSQQVAISSLVFILLACVCFYMIPWKQWTA